MMSDFFMSNDAMLMNGYDLMKGMSDEERLVATAKVLLGNALALALGLAACVVFSGCTTSKVVEQHHHHYYEADTLAQEAQADVHTNNSTLMLDSLVSTLFEKYYNKWQSQENEKETTTETITLTVDSLGRQIRTEQRTTERSLARQQQQIEERMTKEFQQLMSQALSRQDSIWQSRFSQIKVHWQQNDSTINNITTTRAEKIPWYKRWWMTIRGILIGIVIAAISVVIWKNKKLFYKS